MIQTFRFAAAVLCVLAVSGPAAARTVSGERADGMARYWMNLAGYSGRCMDKGLLDKSNAKYLKFASYMGGSLLGIIMPDSKTVQSAADFYTKEGAGGRLHQFDKLGKLVVHDAEFSTEECARLNGLLQTSFNNFAKFVLDE